MEEFYSSRTLLVTGATGFMGKVLLEKLIRSIPTIKRIYVLIRSKKGLSPEERVEALINKAPFTLKITEKASLKKIVAINGDICQPNLGLSLDDQHMLAKEVSVIFHAAASLNMNASLKKAVFENTLSTYRLLEFCKQMTNLVAVVHLSTAFCNIDIEDMEEKIYEPHVDPYKLMDLVQWMDEKHLDLIQESLIQPHPNTYTFSKRLAEYVASDMGKNVPVVIGRPSIVLPSLKEPAPGWVDSFNGPIGLFIAGGKGIIRSVLIDERCVPETVPVDVAINSLIICAFIRATNKFTETPVYNITQSGLVTLTWGEIIEKFINLLRKTPFKIFVWYPFVHGTTNVWLHNITVAIFHMLPAYIIDLIFSLCNQKPFLVNVQKRINAGIVVLGYFNLRKWTFSNKNLISLKAALTPEELRTFYLFDDINVDEYIKNMFFGARKFCLKEDLCDLTKQRRILQLMFYFEYFGRFSLALGVIWCAIYIVQLIISGII